MADSTVDGDGERGEVVAAFASEADPSDVTSTGIGESAADGRAPTTKSTDGAFVGSVDATTDPKFTVDIGVRGEAMVSSAGADVWFSLALPSYSTAVRTGLYTLPVIGVAESTADGELERDAVAATFAGESDPSGVASSRVCLVSEVGPDAAFESVGEGRVPTTVAEGVGISIDGAFVGSTETTTGLESAADIGARGGTMASSGFGVFIKLNDVRAGAPALAFLAETGFDASFLPDAWR